jgi:hypothetical protein
MTLAQEDEAAAASLMGFDLDLDNSVRTRLKTIENCVHLTD